MNSLLFTTKLSFILISLFYFQAINAQINVEDSTVQVIGYWDRNEKQTYLIHERRAELLSEDTVSFQEYQYKVDIQVKDSTADSYIIEWKYYDYTYVSGNSKLKSILKAYQPARVLLKTNELGMFVEIINWEELLNSMSGRIKALIKTHKSDSSLINTFEKIANKYSSKQTIEQHAFAEIQQYYNYHGGKYKLDESLSAIVKTPFINLEEGIDTELNVWLSEINPDDNNYIMQMNKIVNEEMIRKFVYNKSTHNSLIAPEETFDSYDVPQVNVETWAASRIHNSGWLIHSIQTIDVTIDKEINTEERIIELL